MSFSDAFFFFFLSSGIKPNWTHRIVGYHSQQHLCSLQKLIRCISVDKMSHYHWIRTCLVAFLPLYAVGHSKGGRIWPGSMVQLAPDVKWCNYTIVLPKQHICIDGLSKMIVIYDKVTFAILTFNTHDIEPTLWDCVSLIWLFWLKVWNIFVWFWNIPLVCLSEQLLCAIQQKPVDQRVQNILPVPLMSQHRD